MTNAEKYKTAGERMNAFDKYCHGLQCSTIIDKRCKKELCVLQWLELKAEEEKPLPCPFCGNIPFVSEKIDGFVMSCSLISCGYQSMKKKTKTDAIAAHNRVAKAVEESEVKND